MFLEVLIQEGFSGRYCFQRCESIYSCLTLFVVEKLFESSVDPNSLAMIVNCTDFDET